VIFRPQQIHEMRAIAVDVPGVCQSVRHAALRDFAVQTQRRIEVLLGAENYGVPSNIVLDGGSRSPTAR